MVTSITLSEKSAAPVSEIGLGTWQLGTKWGEPFNEEEAEKVLQTAYDNKINLIDTADIYNDGASEKAIGQFMSKKATDFFVITKCGRNLNPPTAEMYTPEAIEKFAEKVLNDCKQSVWICYYSIVLQVLSTNK